MNTSSKKFSNGFEIIFIPRKNTELLSLSLQVDSGSLYDDLGFPSGTAHFLEHILFLGSEKYPSRSELCGRIADDGGFRNGLTDTRYTLYSVETLREYFEKSIEYLDQVIFHPLLREEDFEHERGTIVNEYFQTRNNKDRIFYLLRHSAFFNNKALRESALGSYEGIKKIKHGDVLDFYHRFYQPKRMKLFIAGDFDADYIFSFCESIFGSYRNKNDEYESLPELSLREDKRDLISYDDGYSGVRLSYNFFIPRALFLEQETLFPLRVLADNSSSRLFQVLRSEKSYTYGVYFFYRFYREGVFCSLCTDVSREHLLETKSVIEQEYTRLIERGISERELMLEKKKEKQNLAKIFDATRNLSSFYQSFALHHGRVFDFSREMQKIDELMLDRVNNSLRDLKNLETIWVEIHPEGGEKS